MYIGETGRNFSKRVKEHKTDIKKNKPFSGIARHVNSTGHNFDFENCRVIYPCNDQSKRHIIESSVINHFANRACNLNNGFICLDTRVNQFVFKSCFYNPEQL